MADDDALGSLGLDITPFRKAIADANARMDAMSPTLAKVNASIKQMEVQSAKAAASAKAHQTALVNLGNEMRKLQKINASQVLGSANDPEVKARAARITQLQKEIAVQRELANTQRASALSLATGAEAAKKERDKLAPGIQRADRAAQAEEQTAEAAAGGAFLSRAGLIAGVSAVLYKLGNAIINLGDKASAAIEKFQAGGSRRDAQMPNRQDAALSAGLKPIVEDQTASFTNQIIGAIMGVLAPIGGILSKLTGGQEGADNYWQGIEDIRKAGEDQLRTQEEIAGSEDELSKRLEEQTPTLQSHLRILEQQLSIEGMKLDLANLETIQGREQANQAKAAMGALRMQISNLQFERDQANAASISETEQMILKQQGMKNVAEMVKVELDYTQQIERAIKGGNDELVDRLLLQKAVAENEVKVAEHNLTPKELRDERKEARKFQRDLDHQRDRETDIADRIRRGVHGATPGSRMDRFQRGQEAHAGNANNMGVNTIQANTLNVSQMNMVNQ